MVNLNLDRNPNFIKVFLRVGPVVDPSALIPIQGSSELSTHIAALSDAVVVLSNAPHTLSAKDTKASGLRSADVHPGLTLFAHAKPVSRHSIYHRHIVLFILFPGTACTTAI